MDIKPVIIFGSNTIGKAAVDIFKSNSIDVYCILDDDEATHQQEIGEIMVMGSTSDHEFIKYIGKKCDAFVAYDDNDAKKGITDMLMDRRKVMPVNAVHHRATFSTYADIGHGNYVGAGAVVNAFARVHNHTIIHSNVLIEGDVELEDFVQVGGGSVVNSGVKVGKGAFIGSGVTVVSGVKIGRNARIGAGSVVVSDIKEEETVFGNPAKSV